MISGPSFTIEPWCLRETELDFDRLPSTESLFALSNGHLGVRGNLEEGEPHGLPGTYLNGMYERRPLPYAEAGYGFPEAGQTIVNVTNGKLMRLLVNDELFDLRYGELLHHERALDFRAGTLTRDVLWRNPGHRTIRVRSTRLVSLTQRAIMAIDYEVEAVDGPARVVLQSELVANEEMPPASGDPRVAAVMERPLCGLDNFAQGASAYLVHETARSGLRLAALMDHTWAGADATELDTQVRDDSARVTFIASLVPGTKLRVTKFVGYGWSSARSVPALRDQAAAAVAGARHTGWEGLLAEQRAYLDAFWEHADVEVDGDDEIQQAVRFSLFHVMQAGARAEGRAIPAKGLTGPGYDGHCFWDSESFVLPVLTYTQPQAAGDALAWRHTILPAARERASQLGLDGAAFPWRTIAGEECSAYWPAGTAAFHVGADIADAVTRYVNATGDDAFERGCGARLLVATARLWASLGTFRPEGGGFRIDGVTGPDEYSAVADNNVYTNLMARKNLLAAADVAERYPEEVPDVTDGEVARWRQAAAEVVVPYNEALGVHEQAEGFTSHAEWDFAATPADHYPLLLHAPYFDLYRKQVVKQADLVLALYLCGDRFSAEEKARDFDYYERRTVRDSSLSASTQAILAAETGCGQLAYDYWGEAALIDLDDLAHNTSDGFHMASLAGSWLVAVAGFGGLRDHGGSLDFRPVLPPGLRRLAFRLCWRGGYLQVDIGPGRVTYAATAGDQPVDLCHYGTPVKVEPDAPVTLVCPPATARPAPPQPPGRVPARRIPGSATWPGPASPGSN